MDYAYFCVVATQIGVPIQDMNEMYPKTFLAIASKYSRLKGKDKKQSLTAQEMRSFIRG